MRAQALRRALVGGSLLLASCVDIPDTYAPPIQRQPLYEAPRDGLGSFVAMSDPKAQSYIVAGVHDSEPGSAWRWTGQRPELRFAVPAAKALKFVMDFALPEATFKDTGPVTVSFFIEDKLLDKVRYDQPGEKHFEKPVPASWLRTDLAMHVRAELDKVWVAPADGARLGLLLARAGFVE